MIFDESPSGIYTARVVSTQSSEDTLPALTVSIPAVGGRARARIATHMAGAGGVYSPFQEGEEVLVAVTGDTRSVYVIGRLQGPRAPSPEVSGPLVQHSEGLVSRTTGDVEVSPVLKKELGDDLAAAWSNLKSALTAGPLPAGTWASYGLDAATLASALATWQATIGPAMNAFENQLAQRAERHEAKALRTE